MNRAIFVKWRIFRSIFMLFAAVGTIYGLGLYYLMPDHYFPLYPVIPATYFVMALCLFSALHRYRATSSLKIIALYMVLRGVKVLVTFLLGLLYTIFVNQQERTFLLSLVIFFFIYLIYETRLFYRYEKLHRRRFKKL